MNSQFINCAAHFRNSYYTQQFINSLVKNPRALSGGIDLCC